jgi:hypothetical protein
MKTMTKKSKVVLFSLLGVALLSLTGVGIAGWVITGITSATTGNIAVTVGSTTDKRIKVTATNVTDATLQFDAQNDDTTGPIIAATGSAEDLSFAFTFSVSGISNMGGFTLGYSEDSLTDNGASQLHTAVSANYIVSPIAATGTTSATLPATVAVDAAVTVTAVGGTLTSKVTAYTAPSGTDTGTATISVNGTFAWGTAFGSQNPCLIASNATEETINAYKTGLTALAALNAKKLYITITPTAKA